MSKQEKVYGLLISEQEKKALKKLGLGAKVKKELGATVVKEQLKKWGLALRDSTYPFLKIGGKIYIDASFVDVAKKILPELEGRAVEEVEMKYKELIEREVERITKGRCETSQDDFWDINFFEYSDTHPDMVWLNSSQESLLFSEEDAVIFLLDIPSDISLEDYDKAIDRNRDAQEMIDEALEEGEH